MDYDEEILILGYGNPGRIDDGLGPAFATAVAALKLPGVSVDTDYQLALEDSCTLREYQTVIFADAAVGGEEPFSFYPLVPKDEGVRFSSHSFSPQALLFLTEHIFGHCPKGYMMSIRGYEFGEYKEGLSQQAEANLKQALDFIEVKLNS